MLVCRLQALSFPFPNSHKAEGRLIWYKFPLEIANPPVLLPDQKVASYLPTIWHASNLHLRLHTKTLAKTPIYYGIFTQIHTPKPPDSPFFDGHFPHDQIPIPYSGIWETSPLGTRHLKSHTISTRKYPVTSLSLLASNTPPIPHFAYTITLCLTKPLYFLEAFRNDPIAYRDLLSHHVLPLRS